jgi:hypothetical protein
MVNFFNLFKSEKEKKIEEVKTWFLPLTVFRKPQGIKDESLDEFYKHSEARVNNHLESLHKFGSENVKSWTKIFVDCIADIGESRDTIDDRRKLGIYGLDDYKEEFLNGCINKFKDEKKIPESEENQQGILDSKKQVEKKLNEMNKKDFVLLFAEIMPKLIEARDEQFKKAMIESDRQSERWLRENKIEQDAIRKHQMELATGSPSKGKQETVSKNLQESRHQESRHEKNMKEWRENNVYGGSGWGGSKKKSYKRAIRRTRNSRRTRRSRGSRPNNIHQYKKYNKR